MVTYQMNILNLNNKRYLEKRVKVSFKYLPAAKCAWVLPSPQLQLPLKAGLPRNFKSTLYL